MSFKQSLTLQYFADESNTELHSGWLCFCQQNKNEYLLQ